MSSERRVVSSEDPIANDGFFFGFGKLLTAKLAKCAKKT